MAATWKIALDLVDLDLRDAVADALADHPALDLVDTEDAADVVIADRPAAEPRGRRILKLGEDLIPADAPVALILAAAHLIAAGFEVSASDARAGAAPAPRLSAREQQVLALLVEGAPNKVIARSLGISVSTAKFHVAAVLAKLGARNRAEAVSRALREGLFEI